MMTELTKNPRMPRYTIENDIIPDLDSKGQEEAPPQQVKMVSMKITKNNVER